jgi:hypothetical protein
VLLVRILLWLPGSASQLSSSTCFSTSSNRVVSSRDTYTPMYGSKQDEIVPRKLNGMPAWGEKGRQCGRFASYSSVVVLPKDIGVWLEAGGDRVPEAACQPGERGEGAVEGY